MGQVREVDAISDAIIETEREIAGEAWGIEDTERADATGNRTLESMGDGLEGQHEAATTDEDDHDSDEETDGEESGEEGEDGEDEGSAEGETEGTGDGKTGQQQREQEPPAGRVPSGKLREEAEKRRQAEARIAELEAKLAAAPADNPKVAALEARLEALTTLLNGQRQPPQAVKEEPAEPEIPDIFENPKGVVEYILNAVKQEVAPVRQDVRKTQVETSFEIAHVKHGDAFGKAYEAINGLNPQNPDDRATVQRIYNSPNPGEELVRWHRRTTALARFGDDPDAAEARIREETRQSLLKDPEFRKALLADLKAEAATGENGAPRTITRLPPSAQRARSGSAIGGERMDHGAQDDSEQSVADAAWR